MRHAFGDHVARHAGIKNAQALLGHADVRTTQIYTGAPTLDELATAVEGLRFALKTERAFYPLEEGGRKPARGADRNRTGDLVQSRRRAKSLGLGGAPGGLRGGALP